MPEQIFDSVKKNVLDGLLAAIQEYNQRYQPPEDMFTGDVDYYKLSQDLAFFFPWPVAYEINKLFRPEFSRYDANRLDQIIKTFERLLQFFAYCLIADLHNQIKSGNVSVSDGFRKEFERRFATITIGNLVWVIESVIKAIKASQAEPFFTEINKMNLKQFYGAMQWIVPERNNKGHYKFDESPESVEQKCPVYLLKLFELLSSLAFLTKYHLFSIQEIRVRNSKIKPPEFVHKTMYMHSVQKGRPYTWNSPEFLENHSVIICKNIKNIKDDYLNLSPLIIDTNVDLKEIIRSDDPCSIARMKRDIFLYSRYDGKKRLEYVGTTTTYDELKSGIDLTVLNFYDDLINEHNDITNIITEKVIYENQEPI